MKKDWVVVEGAQEVDEQQEMEYQWLQQYVHVQLAATKQETWYNQGMSRSLPMHPKSSRTNHCQHAFNTGLLRTNNDKHVCMGCASVHGLCM